LKQPLDPCSRCGTPGPQLERCHKPNGALAWFCRACTWIGDEVSLSEAATLGLRKARKLGGGKHASG